MNVTIESIISIAIEVIVFIVVSYFIFYNSWLKSLGKEVAKLSTIKDLTTITENIKIDFERSIEKYKSKLHEELSLKIEPLKSELSKQNISYQIQFSFLHQERSKVIIELYRKLQELHSAMVDWTNLIHFVHENSDTEREMRGKRANTALVEFKNFYTANKIFFSGEFCDFIDKLINDYWNKGWDFGEVQTRISEGNLPPDYFKEYSQQLNEISKEIKEKTSLKITEIENNFRKTLGVEN